MMTWEIRQATVQDFSQIYQLIKQVFEENTKYEMTEEGQRNFLQFIQPSQMEFRYQNGAIFWVCEVESQLVGMIEFAYYNHIYLYFVDKNYRGKGIGKALFNQVKKEIKGNITANSTEYALPIYLKLGFTQNGSVVTRNGIRAYPIIYQKTVDNE
ncbi:GCN5-related N-acetyltransferase [Gloeothece citriformis PCC 7424]|uniref:GCN5-related N-acetyltransferase n=1 Tax=Gloeothece citriformis (strain PCC 7424) TaxID=65393 RepID=B7KG39_GLOC7|nr:GNAT family N-acetyltransferase [Gloeothece citriformis]ACK69232.1 GCN5-related N-acetyltransferase [Gloeothece citriformis PCC 7424]